MHASIFVLISGFIMAVGCGKKEESNSTAPINEGSFAGTWEGACAAAGDGTSAKVIMVIGADKSVKQSSIQYSDAGCATERYISNLYSSLAITGEVSATVKKVDLTVSEFKIKFATDEQVQSANDNLTCGYSNWIRNQEQSCLGKPINGTGAADITLGMKIFNVFNVDGSKLYVGTEVKVEAQRPTAVSSSYAKK
jgi:hypothetical protein